MMLPDQHLSNLCQKFKKVWVTSAFRGANKPNSTLVDLEGRLQNHRLWLEKIQQPNTMRFNRNDIQEAVQGIILSGWSRFTHQTVLSELLPMSIPSLTLCLSVVENKKLTFEALYGQLVTTLHLQPRKITQGMNELYQQSDLRQFINETPWMQSKNKETYGLFCNDAFEIAWVIEKAAFLLKQVEGTLNDWMAVDYGRIIARSASQRGQMPLILQKELKQFIQASSNVRQKTQKKPYAGKADSKEQASEA